MDWLSELLTGALIPSWVALLLILVLVSVPLGPAEPTAVAAGVLVAASVLPPVLTIVVVAVGMTLGDVLTYQAGAAILRRTRRAHRFDRWRQALRARPVRRDLVIIGLRFLPGARTPAALAARGAGVDAGRFILLAAGGSLLWAVLWVSGGGAVAQVVPPGLLAACLVSLLLAVVLFRVLRVSALSQGVAVGLHGELLGRGGLHGGDEAPGVRP